MATRPIFIVEAFKPALVSVETVEFTWHSGMAMSRRKKSMRSLHQAAEALHPDAQFLEVSRMSDNQLGVALSAFNLTFQTNTRSVTVESAFQASKVFERGGPFVDLLDSNPAEAKRDARLQTSGRLTGFSFFGKSWPKEPPTAFYDWIYINALHRKPELAQAVLSYDVFTDIAFNPEKSINCQASAVALYVALFRRGELESALSSREQFICIEASAKARIDTRDNQRRLL